MQTNEEVKSSLELLICGREDDLYGRRAGGTNRFEKESGKMPTDVHSFEDDRRAYHIIL